MWQTLILPCWLALASLTAVHAAEGACQDYTLSPAEAFAGDLGSVDGLTHWEWQAGHEFVKQGSAKLMDNGIKLSLAAESQSSVRLNSRLQFQ